MTNLTDAAKSDWSTSIAMIAGGKAHRVTSRTLLEDAEVERTNWKGDVIGTRIIAAGETLYYGTACGTQRNAKWGMSYQNQYVPADEVTCTKCLAKEEVDEVAAEIVESEDEEIVIKPGRIWTYIYRGETLIAEVRTDSAAAVIAALS